MGFAGFSTERDCFLGGLPRGPVDPAENMSVLLNSGAESLRDSATHGLELRNFLGEEGFPFMAEGFVCKSDGLTRMLPLGGFDFESVRVTTACCFVAFLHFHLLTPT